MKLNGLDIYVEGLAVHLAYTFRDKFQVWSELSDNEQFCWRKQSKDLIAYLKKQKDSKLLKNQGHK